MKILIFSSNKHPFAARLFSQNPKPIYFESHYDDLTFILPNEGAKGIRILVGNKDIRDFDLVFFRHAEKYLQFVGPLSQYLKAQNIPFLDSSSDIKYAGAKLIQMLQLQIHDIDTPKTVVISTQLLPKKYSYVKGLLGCPFIMKENNASHGNLNFLVNTKAQFLKNIKENPQAVFLCQEFLANDFDYRLVTIGYQVKVIKKRIRTNPETHLNNTFLGARVEFVNGKYLSELKALARRSAKLLNINIAGVDILVCDKDKKAYVLEVNKAPDIKDDGSLKAIALYLEKYAGHKSVN
jgi:glutathione synthase/RimK-type ligase-like ATP-grasp enzyme